MNHVLSFLNNPKISDVSNKEKETYLLNKGFSSRDVQRAISKNKRRKSK